MATVDCLWCSTLLSDCPHPTIITSFSLFFLRVLERIGARALVAHVRTFADFLVYEFSTSAGGQQLNKCIEILNDMVWKYNIVTLDRLILCLVRNAAKEANSLYNGSRSRPPFLIHAFMLMHLQCLAQFLNSKHCFNWLLCVPQAFLDHCIVKYDRAGGENALGRASWGQRR